MTFESLSWIQSTPQPESFHPRHVECVGWKRHGILVRLQPMEEPAIVADVPAVAAPHHHDPSTGIVLPVCCDTPTTNAVVSPSRNWSKFFHTLENSTETCHCCEFSSCDRVPVRLASRNDGFGGVPEQPWRRGGRKWDESRSLRSFAAAKMTSTRSEKRCSSIVGWWENEDCRHSFLHCCLHCSSVFVLVVLATG